MPKRAFSLLLIFSLIASGCTQIQTNVTLPTPEITCSASLDWHGIVPGQSSQQDVIKALGTPAQTGSKKFGERSFSFFAYPVEGGTAAPFVQDRVFFRSDGTVDWIEAVIADREDKFHPAQETLDQLGYTLDTAYMNNNLLPPGTPQYDVMHGPAQIYVWSECGLALLVLGICSPAESIGLKCIPLKSVFSGQSFPSEVVLRHPNPYPDAEPILLGADNAVLMRFLFPPTSYGGFTEFYLHRIPYLPWDVYIRDVPIETR